MTIQRSEGEAFEFTIPVVIVGAGACGLTAALAARDAGAAVLVLERGSVPSGTTAMSSGLIPAAGTKAQRAAGIIDDDAAIFARDLVTKTGGELECARAHSICTASTRTVDWLIDNHGVPLTLFTAAGALPGHSKSRLHGTPNRTGEELIAALQSACDAAGADIMTDAHVTALIADRDSRVLGVEVTRPDGSLERIGCQTLILATCGFAANRELVDAIIPELAGIVSHTHPFARGDALVWGQELGAATGHLSAYQGHANLAAGHGLLVSWLTISEGGFQLNAAGERFADESRGYSEQAVDVGRQAGGFAWTIYDARIDAIMQEIAEYRDVTGAGALVRADTVEALAEKIRLPAALVRQAITEIEEHAHSGKPDRFGRRFGSDKLLEAPFVAVRVNPALFHTQGGLVVDDDACVLREDGRPLPNLYAGGGAARGISGSSASGYVAGNGLMSATTYGRLAGEAAAKQALADTEAILA